MQRNEAMVLPEACYSRGHISFWAGRKTSGLESKPTNDILKYKSKSRTDLQMLQKDLNYCFYYYYVTYFN